MNSDELVTHGKRLLEGIKNSVYRSFGEMTIARIQALEFLRQIAGQESSFYRDALDFSVSDDMKNATWFVGTALEAFIQYVESGLHQEISPERSAQLDVISDFLDQAKTFLDTTEVHPAAAAMIIGATLEEFLRTWSASKGLSIEGAKRGLNSYAENLKKANLISTQDVKDITSWAGIRNSAAHGNWDEVSDRKRILIMLEGVNLFMQRHRG